MSRAKLGGLRTTQGLLLLSLVSVLVMTVALLYKTKNDLQNTKKQLNDSVNQLHQIQKDDNDLRNQIQNLKIQISFKPSSLLAYTNSQRAENGDPPLKLDALLDDSAQSKANDMVAKNYWAHDPPGCPSVGECWYKFVINSGYKFKALGENLAYGYTDGETTIAGWMNSPEHRTNMLNVAYTEVGFGVVRNVSFQNSFSNSIVVAHYASPL